MAAKWALIGAAVTVLVIAGCQRQAETGGGGGAHGAQGVATPSVGRTSPPHSGPARVTPAPGQAVPTVPPNAKEQIPGRYRKPATPLAPDRESRNE